MLESNPSFSACTGVKGPQEFLVTQATVVKNNELKFKELEKFSLKSPCKVTHNTTQQTVVYLNYSSVVKALFYQKTCSEVLLLQ